MQYLRKNQNALKKTAVQKTTKVEIEDDVLYVELSPQLRSKLGEAARARGQSETDLIYEAIAEAISKKA